MSMHQARIEVPLKLRVSRRVGSTTYSSGLCPSNRCLPDIGEGPIIFKKHKNPPHPYGRTASRSDYGARVIEGFFVRGRQMRAAASSKSSSPERMSISSLR